MSSDRWGRLRNVRRPDILKNVSLRNELLCWSVVGGTAVREQLRSARLNVLVLAAWLCSHTHTHTHTRARGHARRTSDVRGSMARAFPNKRYTSARSFSPYMRACTTVEFS